SCRRRRRLRLPLEQREDHAERNQELRQVPNEGIAWRTNVAGKQKRGKRKYQSPCSKRNPCKNDSRAELAIATVIGLAGHHEKTKEIKIDPVVELALCGLPHREDRVREQHGDHAVQVPALEAVEAYSLKEPGYGTGKKNRDKDPGRTRTHDHGRHKRDGSSKDENQKQCAFMKLTKDFGNREEERGARDFERSDFNPKLEFRRCRP